MLALFLFMGTIEIRSPCKVNLVLNILGKREDGFHELETVMFPVPFFDRLTLAPATSGISLTCSDPSIPADDRNLVFQAAQRFFNDFSVNEGVAMHLDKRLPHQAGLGGGSANAAVALRALNEMFGGPFDERRLSEMAATLGSDVPFFLSNQPALATGRGELIESLGRFKLLDGATMVLVHPGFGVPTGWAYKELSMHPDLMDGERGRARKLAEAFERGDESGWEMLFNAFERPVFAKYPLLQLMATGLKGLGAKGAMMSGSGSAVFGVFAEREKAVMALGKLAAVHGPFHWSTLVDL